MRHPPFLFLSIMGLTACTTVPSGPSVLVLPGVDKSFDQFRTDDSGCRQFAQAQLNGATPDASAAHSGVATAVVGTVIGAAAGAAINGSSGAGVGAGTGLAMGGLAGMSSAQYSQYAVQRRYDNSYQQCMYAHGHRVPVTGPFVTTESANLPPPYPAGRPPQ